jgi:hypothetical protein
MPLPNPGQDAVPFTTLTAQFYDETIENIESLADGSGFDAGAVVQDAVIGTLTGATLGTTGNKAVTGVGFTPKIVMFDIVPSNSATVVLDGSGAMTASGQYTKSFSGSSGGHSRYGSTSNCISWVSAGSVTPSLLASRVSMDADGFTINVTTAANNFDVAWKAIG